MVKVYKHAHVQEIQQFYGELLAGYSKWTVKEHLQLLSERLLEGYRAQQTLVTREINNYHPAWLGRPADEILNAGLDRSDMRQVIASEYGFASWEKVWAVDRRYDPNFEEALNHLLNGGFVGEIVSQAKFIGYVDIFMDSWLADISTNYQDFLTVGGHYLCQVYRTEGLTFIRDGRSNRNHSTGLFKSHKL